MTDLTFLSPHGNWVWRTNKLTRTLCNCTCMLYREREDFFQAVIWLAECMDVSLSLYKTFTVKHVTSTWFSQKNKRTFWLVQFCIPPCQFCCLFSSAVKLSYQRRAYFSYICLQHAANYTVWETWSCPGLLGHPTGSS